MCQSVLVKRDKNMFDVLLLVLCSSLKLTNSQNGEIYKAMEFPNEVWTPFVFKTFDHPKTLIECGAMCLFHDGYDPKCQGFKFDTIGNCHLVNLDLSSNLLSGHSDDKIHLNLQVLKSYMGTLADFYNVTLHDYWFEKITTVKEMQSPAIPLDCWNYCVNVLKSDCEFFVLDIPSSTCIFGVLSHTDGTEPDISLDGDISLIAIKGIFNFLCLVLNQS